MNVMAEQSHTRDGSGTVRVSIDVSLDPAVAFDALVDELTAALSELDLRLTPGHGGLLLDGQVEIGRIVEWAPAASIRFEWHPAGAGRQRSEMVVTFEALDGATRVRFEHRRWAQVVNDDEELLGWFARYIAAPLLRASTPQDLGDWLTDRLARRPSGRHARDHYRDPLRHRPNFRAVLNALALRPDDYLIDIGCGGGAFLKQALASGCRGAGVDHSREMVQVASELNGAAVAEGRLSVVEGVAERLPFADATFTCASMLSVYAFLPEPVRVLVEVRRVLRPGGRLALFVGSADLKGTAGLPEPVGPRVHLYQDAELLRHANEAGFMDVRIERPDLRIFAREEGVPESELALFAERSWQLLTARAPTRQPRARGKRA